MKTLLTLLFSLSLFAQNEWYFNYYQAKKVALEHNKLMIVVMRTIGCPYCEKFINRTLMHPKVKKELENYVVVLIEHYKVGTYPKHLEVIRDPITFKIDPHTDEYDMEIIGYVDVDKFLDELHFDVE